MLLATDEGSGFDAPAPEFPREDIDILKAQRAKPDQFQINFDYLVRRVTRNG